MKLKELEAYQAKCRRPFRYEKSALALNQQVRADNARNSAFKPRAGLLFECPKYKCLLGVVFLVLFSGCANVNNRFLSSGPRPRVEDCAMIQQATPTRYVCDGKVYTSVQLDEISKGEEVQLSQQASHGAFPGNVIGPTGNFGINLRARPRTASGSGIR